LEVKRVTWPAVYRESYPQRLLAAAAGMADTSDEQRKQLEAIGREYEAAAAGLNARWSRGIDEREENAEGPMEGGFIGFGEDADSDEAKAKSQRAGLDRSATERIRQVLTPAQWDRLPGEDDL